MSGRKLAMACGGRGEVFLLTLTSLIWTHSCWTLVKDVSQSAIKKSALSRRIFNNTVSKTPLPDRIIS